MFLVILFLLGFLVYRIACYFKSKQFNIWRELAIWTSFIYLVVVSLLTIFKHGVFDIPINLNSLKSRLNLIPLVETFKMLTGDWVVAYSWYQVIANVLVFIPLGFLSPLLFKVVCKWWHVLIVGLSGSLLIEGLQILTSRNIVDIDDLIFNTLGAMIGYVVYLVFIKIVKQFNLMRYLEKFEVHLSEPILKVASIPFSIMFLITWIVSGFAYFESTLSSDLSDEELVTAYLSYKGETLSKRIEDYRFILKDYEEYLDLDIYQNQPFNRVRMVSGRQWNPEYNEENYEFMFLTEDFRVDDESIFVIFGKNEEATQIKITYLENEYVEDLPIGNFLIVYPETILMGEGSNLYQLYDGKSSDIFKVEFLNEDGEVIDSL